MRKWVVWAVFGVVVASTPRSQAFAQELGPEWAAGLNGALSVEGMPGPAFGAELELRATVSDGFWMVFDAAVLGAPDFTYAAFIGPDTGDYRGDALGLEGWARVGGGGLLVPDVRIGVLTGIGIGAHHGWGTTSNISGVVEWSEWSAFVQIPVDLEVTWSFSEGRRLMISCGPAFTFHSLHDELPGPEQQVPRIGTRARIGVLFDL